MRSHSRILILLFLVFVGFSPFNSVEPQDFPYLAPAAPELDNAGSPLKGPSKSGTQTGIGPKIAPFEPETLKNFGFGASNQASEERAAANPPTRSNHRPTAPANGSPKPPMRQEPQDMSTARRDAPVKQPRTVDCSQYPMLIANARSQAEMQITARYYLTCLLQQGWLMENAKAQVIQTIESVTRGAR
ncbi:MAG: hypothetical protein M1511_07555 [Deltaproteobacteria bacterium]|nr:hypothetical protein [Deltaproteobacteria bacterium]